MDTLQLTPMTPEQIAAVRAGDGYAQFEDPTTHERYHVVRHVVEPIVFDDEYLLAKAEEAYADAAGLGPNGDGFEPLDMKAVKAEFLRRRAAKKQQNGG